MLLLKRLFMCFDRWIRFPSSQISCFFLLARETGHFESKLFLHLISRKNIAKIQLENKQRTQVNRNKFSCFSAELWLILLPFKVYGAVFALKKMIIFQRNCQFFKNILKRFWHFLKSSPHTPYKYNTIISTGINVAVVTNSVLWPIWNDF